MLRIGEVLNTARQLFATMKSYGNPDAPYNNPHGSVPPEPKGRGSQRLPVCLPRHRKRWYVIPALTVLYHRYTPRASASESLHLYRWYLSLRTVVLVGRTITYSATVRCCTTTTRTTIITLNGSIQQSDGSGPLSVSVHGKSPSYSLGMRCVSSTTHLVQNLS